MKAYESFKAKVHGVGEHFEAFLEKHESKIIGGGALAVVGAAVINLGTGNVSAATNDTEVVKYYGMSMITWIFAVFALLFGVGTLWLRDFRIAILAALSLVGVVIVSYLGI
jgi:uncharacterized membrane protein